MGGKNAGSKAADAQIEGIEKGIEEQRRQFDLSRQDIAPYRFAGLVALRQLLGGEMGLPYFGDVTYDPSSGNINIARTGTNVDAPRAVAPIPEGISNKERFRQLAAGGYDNIANWLTGSTQIRNRNGTWSSPSGDTTFTDAWLRDFAAQQSGQGAGGGAAPAAPVTTQPAPAWQPGQPIPRGIPASMIVPEEDNSALYNLWAQAQQPQTAPAPVAAQPAAPTNLPPQQPLESGFKASPGYQFRLNEGLKAVERSAAARGLLGSGRTLKALQEYGEGLAADEYGNYYNRLAALAGVGQTATSNLAGLRANMANQVSQGYSDMGAARASGIVADANARASGFGNLLTLGTMAATGGFGGFGAGAGSGFGMTGRTVAGLPWLG